MQNRCRHCGKFLDITQLRKCTAQRGEKPRICISAPNFESIRGRDRKKLGIQWEDPELLFEHNGQRVVRLHTRADVRQFGKLMGHCAGDHMQRINKGDWHFITILTEDNVPHVTIHAKHSELAHTYDGYTGSTPKYTKQVSVQNHNCMIVAAYVKGGYGEDLRQHRKYGETLSKWLEAAEPEGAKELSTRRVY